MDIEDSTKSYENQTEIDRIKRMFTEKDDTRLVMRVVHMPDTDYSHIHYDYESPYNITETVISPKMEMFDDNMNYIEGKRKLEVGYVHVYDTVGGETLTPEQEKRELISYEDCSPEDKLKILEKEERLKTIKESKDEEYDKPGKMYFKYKGEKVEVEVTQRQLAEAGLEASDVQWKSLEQIKELEAKEEEKRRRDEEEKIRKDEEEKSGRDEENSNGETNLKKEIAEADMEKGLTKTEIGGIRGFFKKILDKFKGKGEK